MILEHKRIKQKLACFGKPPVQNLFNVSVGELFASMFHVTT